MGVAAVKDLVETALGVVLVACLALAAILLPCALIDMAAGTNLLEPVATALFSPFQPRQYWASWPSSKDATPTINRDIAH